MRERWRRSARRGCADPSGRYWLVGTLVAVGLVAGACSSDSQAGESDGASQDAEVTNAPRYSGSERDDASDEYETTTEANPAAVDAALTELLAIRRAPSELGWVLTFEERDVYGAPFVVYGPYPDGPQMTFTTEAAGLATPEAIETQLAAAADAVGFSEEQRTELDAVLDLFVNDPELASRVPSTSLQAVGAYMSAVLARPSALGGPGAQGPIAWTYPNAEPLPELDVMARLVGESTYEDDFTRSARASHGFVYTTDNALILTADPARRFEDVRYALALISHRRINCSDFNASCVLLRQLHTLRTYLDFVLADPALARASTYSARELNTSLLAFLNSSDQGALAPAIEPDEPAVLFPDTDRFATTRPAPDEPVQCEDADGESIDCWQLDYVVADSWLAHLQARIRGTVAKADLEPITTSPSVGTVLSRIGFEAEEVADLNVFDADARELLDEHMAEVFPPEDNVVFRLLLGVLDEDDLAVAAEDTGLGQSDLVAHLEHATGVASLSDFLEADGPDTRSSPIPIRGLDLPLEPGDAEDLRQQTARLYEIFFEVNESPDPRTGLWLESVSPELRQQFNQQSQSLLEAGEGLRPQAPDRWMIDSYRVRGRSGGIAVAEFCFSESTERFELETDALIEEVISHGMYRQGFYSDQGDWIIYDYVDLRYFDSAAECVAALDNRTR